MFLLASGSWWPVARRVGVVTRQSIAPNGDCAVWSGDWSPRCLSDRSERSSNASRPQIPCIPCEYRILYRVVLLASVLPLTLTAVVAAAAGLLASTSCPGCGVASRAASSQPQGGACPVRKLNSGTDGWMGAAT